LKLESRTRKIVPI
jgi:hypothetical protein